MKKAQSLIEYVLILVLISLIAITTLHFLGKRMSFGEEKVQADKEEIVLETMIKYCDMQGQIYSRISEKCVSFK